MLTQLAKRRKRIVHNADLPTRTAIYPEAWQFSDYWRLVMWLLAVSAFYYQLCISIGAAGIVEKTSLQNHMVAMHEWRKVGVAFTALPKAP
jgi:hypothetical protein